MTRLPKNFYRVEVTSGAGKLRVYAKKSSTYASEHHAREHLDRLRAQGVECDLYWTPATWSLVDKQPELEGQEELF